MTTETRTKLRLIVKHSDYTSFDPRCGDDVDYLRELRRIWFKEAGNFGDLEKCALVAKEIGHNSIFTARFPEQGTFKIVARQETQHMYGMLKVTINSHILVDYKTNESFSIFVPGDWIDFVRAKAASASRIETIRKEGSQNNDIAMFRQALMLDQVS